MSLPSAVEVSWARLAKPGQPLQERDDLVERGQIRLRTAHAPLRVQATGNTRASGGRPGGLGR